MSDYKETPMTPEEELVEVLLDFVIVSATLAKKVTEAVREKSSKEGAFKNVKNERIGCRNQRSANCGGCY